jgi:hypothetical protein
MATQVTTTQNLQVRSGNKIIAMFGGVQIGLLQDIRFSENYDPAAASGVGNIYVQEWVPTIARYEISTRFMVLNLQSLYNVGAAPVDGDAALQGLVFDIQIMDRNTGSVLRKYVGCSYASGNIEVTKHQIVVMDATFMCLTPTGTM